MKKYICTVCDWVYDPDKGDPDGGILLSKIFPTIGFVHFVVWGKMISRSWKNKKREGGPSLFFLLSS